MTLTTTREKGDKVFVLHKDQIMQLEISQVIVFYGDNSNGKSDSIRENFGLIVSFYIHYDKFVGSVDKIDETKKYNYINLFNGRTNVSYDDLPTTPGKALEPAIYYVLNNCI